MDRPLPRHNKRRFFAKSILYPRVKTLVLEGELDKRLILKYVRGNGINAAVYSINEIDVSIQDDDLQRLENGNKGRVVQLSRDALDFDKAKIMCVVDKDTDPLIDRNYENNFCFYHPYVQMDWTPLAPNSLKSVVSSLCRQDVSQNQLDLILDDAKYATSLRAYRDRNHCKVKLPSCSRKIDGDGRLNREAFLGAFCQKIGENPKELSPLVHEIYETPGDFRMIVHFKDFLGVLFTSLNKQNLLRRLVSKNDVLSAFRSSLFLFDFNGSLFWSNLVSNDE